MTAIHHRHQAYPRGPAPGLEGLQGSPHGSPREDHVIHQHHLAAIQRHGQVGGLAQPGAHPFKVVAIKSGINRPLVNRVAGHGRQPLGEHLGQGDSAGGDAQQQQGMAIGRAFEHLGGQPIEGSGQILGREQFQPMHQRYARSVKPVHGNQRSEARAVIWPCVAKG